MKEVVKGAALSQDEIKAERIRIGMKLDPLYPSRNNFDRTTTRAAREFINEITERAHIAGGCGASDATTAEQRKEIMLEQLKKIVEHACEDATGEPISGDYGARGRLYLLVMKNEGTKEEKGIAAAFFKNVVDDEMKKKKWSDWNIGRIERAADMLLFIEDFSADEMLHIAGKKMWGIHEGCLMSGVIDTSAIGRTAEHVTAIAEILRTADDFAQMPLPKDAFKGWQWPGH